MKPTIDGPRSPLFSPIDIRGTAPLLDVKRAALSSELTAALPHAPAGDCVCRGIPFHIACVHLVAAGTKTSDTSANTGNTVNTVNVDLRPFTGRQLVFLHTSDLVRRDPNEYGFTSPMRGAGALNEHAATYTVVYEDGSSESAEIRRRHHIGAFQRGWGENCFQAVPHRKPQPIRAHHEQPNGGWGWSQTRATAADMGPWVYWLWAWENPHPERTIVALRFTPVSGTVVVAGLAVGDTETSPLRWEMRQKAVIRIDRILPPEESFDPMLDDNGLLSQIRIDLGQVISAEPRRIYPVDSWEDTYNNQLPERSDREILVEYTANPSARFHFPDGRTVPLPLSDAVPTEGAKAAGATSAGAAGTPPDILSVPESHRRVRIRIVDRETKTPVPAKLHVHGAWGEYLAPVDRHRIPNYAWFEDYSTDFIHAPAGRETGPNGLPYATHLCTYVPGETTIDLPYGAVYVEVSKGYEMRPVRFRADVSADTETIDVEVEHVLPWRSKGWVSADTHVHFLSPSTAQLEGSAEGVNVVNLLASQWGELMTNVGDFDGRTTWGSREAGGDGEYLVRVGTENRQHVMGHISLLGYEGNIIAPMTTGGPDESAFGDPVGTLLTEWAARCKEQNGVVVLPHFPNPRAENAATIVEGKADGVEMTSWGNLYAGINPYSLSDWYRYLNCGYPVAAVGGTDKMSAATAVGTVRTYARIPEGAEFSYEAWKDAVRRMETFVTYGPLLELSVEGQPIGGRVAMPAGGGTVNVSWEVQSITVPVSRVDLVINGEIRESVGVDGAADGSGPAAGGGAAGDEAAGGRAAVSRTAGNWSVKIDRSSWIALLVRGHYPDKPAIIAAHSSAVFVPVEGSEFYAAADALTILEQIEGAMAYLDAVGTRAEQAAYKRMRMVLEGAHRRLHNRMHELGHFHEHTSAADHKEHH